MNNNKRVYLIIGVISVIILALGVTTAWFTWRSSINTDVTFNVEGLDITYTGDANILNKKLYPTASMTNTDNVIHKFSLVTTSNIDIYTKISLDIIKLDDNLKDVSFRWDLYKEDTSIASGNFTTATVGSNMLLTPYEMITTTPTNYTLYIWIDGENYSNPIAMGGKEFNFKLKLEAGQQAYVTPSTCFTYLDNYEYTINETTCLSIYGNLFNTYLGSDAGEMICKGNKEKYGDLITLTNAYGVSKDQLISQGVITISDGNKNGNGTISIVNYTCGGTADSTSKGEYMDVVVPETIDGKSVTRIGAMSFAGYNLEGNAKTGTLINSVLIPDSVIAIETTAFWKNNLVDATISNNVNSIGNYAFYNNKLTNVIIPNSVTIIGDNAFQNNNLTNINIPDNVTTIGDYAFDGNNLTSIIIPDSVTEIGNYAFLSSRNSNPNLTTIYNLSGKSFNWEQIITYSSGTAFVSGTITTTDGRTVTITTKE